MAKKIDELAAVTLGIKKGQIYRSPIKDGNEQFDKDPDKYAAYKGKFYISLKRPGNLEPPIVYDELGNEMLSQADLYSGCFAVAQVSFKAYTTFGGGITCYWSALKKISDGERLGMTKEKFISNEMDSQTSGIKIVNGKAVY